MKILSKLVIVAFLALCALSVNAGADGLRGAERQLQSLDQLQNDLADANRLLARLEARRQRRERRGRDTSNLERRIANLLEDIADIEAQIEQLSSGGGGDGGGNGGTGELVTLDELATLAENDSRFNDLELFDDDFGADSVRELLSRTSRSQQGFLDFFFQSMRCPLSFQTTSSTREGDQIDQLRISVATDLGVQINEFLCPSRI